jgi:hypothetical protein
VTEKDLITFQKRCESEGLSFLTTTLPTLGKSLDAYFSTGEYTCPQNFAKSKAKHEYSIPKFLGKAVLHALRGDSTAVDCVRQLAYVFYRLEVPYEPELQKEFLSKFRETDSSLSSLEFSSCSDEILADARLLISRILCNSDPRDIKPRHSNGATACHAKNWDKYHQVKYFSQLDDIWPYSDYFFYSPTHLVDEYEKLENMEVGVPQARVVLVPKDSRGPRVISCEPAELMYIQQGLMKLLYEVLETHPLSAGFVNFTDQRINQRLARVSSIDQRYATLDMKDASDRVSLSLVKTLFPSHWVEALISSRSSSTRLPDGSVVELNKFAPMGSSCCFPIEAIVFWAIAWSVTRGHPVYVYGDDIICFSSDANRIMDAYERYGLMVNRSKSYVSGPFRESCGGDYHIGNDVTPVRVKKWFGASHSDWIAAIELCNNLIAKFGYGALPIIRMVEEIYGPIPRTEFPIPGTFRLPLSASNDVFFRKRYNHDLQRIEYRIRQLVPKPAPTRETGWAELLRFELESGVENPANSGTFFGLNMSKRLNPGEYVETHSTRSKWAWAWLG